MSSTREEALAKGYKVYCLHCNMAYKAIPQVHYEDGHGGRMRDSCKRCDCDLFADLATDKPVVGS